MMSRFFNRYVVMPCFETLWKRRGTFGHLANLERTQWLSRAELDALQLAALKKLLAHAAANCTYYRDSWGASGLDPEQVETVEDFRRWPVIDRDVVRAHRMELRAAVPGLRLIRKATGGSTGDPLTFDLDQESNDRRVAASYRGYEWAGAGPGTKQ